ncbi:MAG: SDR family oxidoreductase [Pedosphaera parvula]|nr:SDR family oxidoreductase [Pedosphaera parvula]
MNPCSRVSLVTGAGSGVGRAVVLKLAAEGWSVALAGRRPQLLTETIALAGPAAAPRLAAFPCDVGDPVAVKMLHDATLACFGRVDAVVAAAGSNTPRRSWNELTAENYHALLAANLHSAFYCVQAFLPGMRQRATGTFIFINSEAGLRASSKSGVAYIAAKFGLTGLAQSLNAEEHVHGIRACSIFPGDINTPLLDQRPYPPPAELRARMLQPDDVAACVWLALNLPPRASIEELVLRPSHCAALYPSG